MIWGRQELRVQEMENYFLVGQLSFWWDKHSWNSDDGTRWWISSSVSLNFTLKCIRWKILCYIQLSSIKKKMKVRELVRQTTSLYNLAYSQPELLSSWGSILKSMSANVSWCLFSFSALTIHRLSCSYLQGSCIHVDY